MKATNFAKSFHTYSDFTLLGRGPGVTESIRRTHAVIQERELTFRMHPHFHPYADDLMRRLVTVSMQHMLEADTEYAARGETLPRSVDVVAAAGTALRVKAATPCVLVENATGTTAGGQIIELSAGLRVLLVAEVAATIADRLTLVDAWPTTPVIGQPVKVTTDADAETRRDVEVPVPAGAQIALHDGSQATLNAEARALIPSGAAVIVPNGASVTPLRFKRRPVWYDDASFKKRYRPGASVKEPLPVNELDFSIGGAYACYNREIVLEVPLLLAIHLRKNGCFEAAQRCLHLLFDPTDDSDGPTPQRFWKVGFFRDTDVQKIEELLVNLSTGADPALRDETVRCIEAWKDAPFRPHVIARYRHQAYMYKVVMEYLENLIAWGDSLFRNDTPESVDEAQMLYVLAANILGPRPQPVPAKGTMKRQTYAGLKKDLDAFGNAMREVEAAIPFDLLPAPTGDGATSDRLLTVSSIGKALYFCVPRNDKLLGYWDTVADRLFKIRNSLNAQGVFRQLPLFAPPIDPAVLARAVAAGVDTTAIVNGLNQPLPLVRFQFLVQKATEICQEVKSLGQNLLAAMEKEDGEAMMLLRTRHERAVTEMAELVRYAQLQEASKSKEGVMASLALAVQRYTYYQRQAGRTQEEIENAVPELVDLDAESLRNMKLAVDEPWMPLEEIAVDIAQDLGASRGAIISSHESEEIEKSGLARDIQDVIRFAKLAAQGIRMLPDFGVKFHFWGLGGDMRIGGTTLGEVASYAAEVSMAIGDRLSYEAAAAGRMGGFVRREQEWKFQSNLAAGEISQAFKQLRAAELREAIAAQELENHRKQKNHAQEIEQFLNEEGNEAAGKATNKSLYAWIKREVKGLYSQSFQLAFDVAKKAERALQHELGTDTAFVRYAYLAGKEGLLAGEKLLLDVKRMELAYHELNRREYELTRHVSLLQLDPEALLRLRTTGRCRLKVPEALFDMDGPGHYFRRIKSVAVTIPCVTGAYAGVACTLTLLRSSIRTKAAIGDGYSRTGVEDGRFSDYLGSMQSIVTSSAQNDSGLFETSLRDERYLPFENAGVISDWQLELPANPAKQDPCQFDYNTISDVILHFRYTAREGGGLLKREATAALRASIEAAEGPGTARLFSVRHDFPTEWARFTRQTPDENGRFPLSFQLRREHYPFWSEGRRNKVKAVRLVARTAAPALTVVDAEDPDRRVELVKDTTYGVVAGTLADVAALEAPVDNFSILLSEQKLDDLWIIVTWSAS